jgi:hypothetical protein
MRDVPGRLRVVETSEGGKSMIATSRYERYHSWCRTSVGQLDDLVVRSA